jgi:hypothetical protein
MCFLTLPCHLEILLHYYNLIWLSALRIQKRVIFKISKTVGSSA